MTAAPSIDAFVGIARPGEEAVGAALSAGARSYVRALRAHLAELQAAGASGASVNAANSDGLDRLIRRLYDLAASAHYALHGATSGRVALVAVGGYARREMSIGSDVDLLVLEDDGADELSAHVAQRVQTALWDAGLQVGAAVRTAADSVALAQTDVATQTALLAARFLAGDATLFHELMRAVRERAIPELAEFAEKQQAAMRERHVRLGESLYLLQPNVKEGAGGLRDYHTAYWVARACERDFRELQDLLYVGFLTEAEMREYQAAIDFLWRVRNQLHLETKRKSDQMSFELQEQLANQLGFERDLVSGELPVERFMRAYYRNARAVQSYSEIVIEQCLARVRPPQPSPSLRTVADGFRVAGGQLEIPHAALLRERPLRLLTAFAVAQDHDVPLSRAARRLIREQLDLIDDRFRTDPAATIELVRILASPRRVMRSLMAMNEVGLLGRYLPEWEHIVCRWQHVIYHTYTVDVHSIFLVEELRRLWQGKYAALVPDLTELAQTAEDLPMVYLGCLLHDIGKGYGGDHSSIGAELGERCLERLGLAPERAARADFIIRHHLLMSHVAQRRDLSDPKVIVEFARTVGDRENLHNLYLATFADMRASSKSAWTEWRAELLRELFERTAEFLESGGEDQDFALELIEARVEQRIASAREELVGAIAEARIDAFFEMMPRRYFVAHTPPQIVRHAHALIAFDPERQRFARTVRDMRAGFSELIVWARDQHGLYADVAGSLTAAGVNILGSHVYTTRTGLALEVYRVATPGGSDADREERWQRFDGVLAALAGEAELAELIARQRRPLGAKRITSHLPPAVAVRNDISDFYTVIDVNADDRLGLLYDLTRTIAAHGLEIYVSKATTVLDQAADSFYVKTPDEKRLLDPDDVAGLRRALLGVVGGDPEADAHG